MKTATNTEIQKNSILTSCQTKIKPDNIHDDDDGCTSKQVKIDEEDEYNLLTDGYDSETES